MKLSDDRITELKEMTPKMALSLLAAGNYSKELIEEWEKDILHVLEEMLWQMG